MPKNCLVDVAPSRLSAAGSLVLLEVMVESGDVGEGHEIISSVTRESEWGVVEGGVNRS